MTEDLRLNELAEGALTAHEVVLDGERESLILLREDAQVRAWLNVCPHAGRRLDYAPGAFLLTPAGLLMCAVHGATFELPGGECVGGPCVGARLRAVHVRVSADGVLAFGEAP